MTTFVVKQSEASFEARFASPMFALLGPTVFDLHQNMFLSLRKHGLTLGDIRVESGSSNLAGANVTYGLNTLKPFVAPSKMCRIQALARPNNALQLTASSLCSSVAPASGSS